MTSPRRAIALIALLVRSPKVDVVVSDSEAGQALGQHLDERFLGIFPQNRLCQGVLILPERPSDYLCGRRRRTVRTNLRRAVAAGIHCETIDSPSDALDAAWRVVHARRAPTNADDLATLTGGLPTLFGRPEVTLLVARDHDSSPRAVAAVVIDDNVCLIRLAVSSSHEARWALHHHLVLTLIARRVKYLLAACDGPFGALGLARNEQYYQHLLGYDLCHVGTREKAGL
ncbi:MAG TPA: hypothetical protein VG186_13680 [Solirubrobacteraceae bacterium]|jgi:hypothetical protein|nr:hypothetical protein [Solirubrobacteraceae bacterium]